MPAKEIQALLGISRPTEYAWRKKHHLPTPMILGRRVFYLRDEVGHFLQNKGKTSF